MTQDWEEGDGDYLAPELLQEANPTPAADIFSLGATLYECATGEPNTIHLIGLHDLCRSKSSAHLRSQVLLLSNSFVLSLYQSGSGKSVQYCCR